MATRIWTRWLLDWCFCYLTFRSSLQSMNLYLTGQISGRAFHPGLVEENGIESCSTPLQHNSLCPIWHAWGQLRARLWTCTTVAASLGVTAHQTHLRGCGESEPQSHKEPSRTITRWFIRHNWIQSGWDDCRSCRRQMTNTSHPALSACNCEAISLFFSHFHQTRAKQQRGCAAPALR